MTGGAAEQEAVYRGLLAEARALVAGSPALSALAAGGLDGDLPFERPEPQHRACLSLLPKIADHTAPGTEAITAAILAGAPHLHWRQTYRDDQVGADFTARSGWFNLVSPEGPFLSQELRLSAGFWDHGLVYPWHWHRPVEIYLVLAGRAVFRTGGMADADLGPGGSREHASAVVHSAEMRDAPLLAMALWRGEGLNDASTLCDAPAEAAAP